MKHTHAIAYRDTPVISNRKVQNGFRNVLMTLSVPIVFTLFAFILGAANGDYLLTSPKLAMSLVRSITATIVAAMALNANLNSGRMDFSLGATGILAAVLASLIVNDVSTISNIIAFLFLTIAFGMALSLVHAVIFIFLKLPPIVTSLGMCLIYEGITKLIVGGNNQVLLTNSGITSNFFLEPIVIFPILAIVILIMSLMLCYSKWGYDKNALVYDQKISVDTGIKEIRNCVVCFLVAGALIGLYQVLDITSQSLISVKTDLGSSTTVFQNFLPIFIGGILAKYSNQVIGLLAAVFATEMLYLGFDAALTADWISLIKGFMVFAVLVYMVDKNRFINWVKMTAYTNKKKYLGFVEDSQK